MKRKITEETKRQIKQILAEYFYAHERKEFKRKVWGVATQMVLHWSYIRYVRIANIDDRDIPHWKQELENWILSICETDISKNNSPKARFTAIKEEWDDLEYSFNKEKIFKLLSIKLKKKGYKPTKNEIDVVVNDFIENLPVMMNIMANQDVEEMDSYLETL